MPNYVYRGMDCQHEFEVYQSFAEDPLTECNECGQPVRRVIHPTGIVFKGSGWYITDSRGTPSAPKAAKTDTANDAAPASAAATAPKAEPAAATTAAVKDA